MYHHPCNSQEKATWDQLQATWPYTQKWRWGKIPGNPNQKWSLLATAYTTNNRQSNKISRIPKTLPPQLPTERASPGVRHTSQTSIRVRLNSVGPSPDPTEVRAGPTSGSTVCHWQLLLEKSPGALQRSTVRATSISTSKEWNRNAKQNYSLRLKFQSKASWWPKLVAPKTTADQQPDGCVQIFVPAINHHGVEQLTVESAQPPQWTASYCVHQVLDRLFLICT